MAGFTLHHFFSNEADILRGIGAPCEVQPKNLDLERGEKMESVLGMKFETIQSVEPNSHSSVQA